MTQNEIDEKLANLGPALLKGEWKKKWSKEKPTTGYCYLMSEALYYTSSSDMKSFYVKMDGGTHWFLKENGKIIDLTANQYDRPVPYYKGKRAAFYKGKVKTAKGFMSKNGFLLAKYLKWM